MMESAAYGAAPQRPKAPGAPPEPPGLPVETLVQWFEDAEESSNAARAASERDRDYYDNKQLTAAELAELKKRGQPDIIINRIQTKVNYLLGYEASQRTDPRAFPPVALGLLLAGVWWAVVVVCGGLPLGIEVCHGVKNGRFIPHRRLHRRRLQHLI